MALTRFGIICLGVKIPLAALLNFENRNYKLCILQILPSKGEGKITPNLQQPLYNN